MRVGHFLPAYGSSVHPHVWRQAHLEQQAAAQLGYELIPSWSDELGVDKSRNKAIEGAIAAGLDVLVMQDCDTWSEGAIIPRLLAALVDNEATIAGAAVRLRRKSREVAYQPTAPEHTETPGCYEVDRVGTGLIALDLNRLGRLDWAGPWCDRTYADARHTTLAVGGDYWLCEMTRHHGGKVVVCTDVSTGHAFRDIETLAWP